MKKLVFLCIAACCLFGCQNAEKKAKQHGEAQIVQENGEKLTVEVELVNGKLRNVDIDETVEGKKQTKKELKEEYQMKQASSIGKEWYCLLYTSKALILKPLIQCFGNDI